MLPLGLLKAACGSPILVELKSGETLNGHLVACDTWMNLTIREVVRTSLVGTGNEIFEKIPEIYVKGSFIKYLQVDEQFVDQIKETQQQYRMDNNRQRYNNNNNNNRNQRGFNRGGRGGRNNYNNRNYQNNNMNRGNNRYNNNDQRQGNPNNNGMFQQSNQQQQQQQQQPISNMNA